MSFFRSRSTIQSWVDEFAQLNYLLIGEVRVLEQDGAAGDNTGLVVVQLNHDDLAITIQPREIGSPWWAITMETVDEQMVLSPSRLAAVAANLMTVSALCAFLEAKSTAFVGDDESELLAPHSSAGDAALAAAR